MASELQDVRSELEAARTIVAQHCQPDQARAATRQMQMHMSDMVWHGSETSG